MIANIFFVLKRTRVWSVEPCSLRGKCSAECVHITSATHGTNTHTHTLGICGVTSRSPLLRLLRLHFFERQVQRPSRRRTSLPVSPNAIATGKPLQYSCPCTERRVPCAGVYASPHAKALERAECSMICYMVRFCASERARACVR